MHQILALRDYVDVKTGKTKKADKFFEKNWRTQDLADLFKRPEHYLDMIPEQERINLYYTVSECAEEKGRKFLRQRDLPFDIDDIDTTQEEMTAKVAIAALGLDWYKVAVLASGNGVQFLVRTYEPFEDPLYFEQRRDDYKACCNKINEALRKANLPGQADSSVWSPARLMRMPLTWNEKPDKPKKLARILQNNLEPCSFDFKKAAGIPVVEQDEEIKQFPPPDTNAVLAGCEQFKWMLAEPNKVSEPEWYAALSVLSRVGDTPVESREIAHRYSKGYSGYSPSETDIKIDQAMKASGPRTCKSFNMLNDKCAKCAHWGKVKSPILIRGEDYIATKATKFHHMRIGEDGQLVIGKPDYTGLVKWFKKQHKYIVVNDTDQIYTFNGITWDKFTDSDIHTFATKWFQDLTSSGKSREFMHLLKHQPGVGVSRQWFSDSTQGRICFSNGVYDIKKKELLPHSEEFGFINTLDYPYDPNATAPRFEKFLDEVTLGYEGYKKTLLEFAGYCFSNDDYWEHIALLLYGGGNNGKSVFLSTLLSMAGDAASSVAMKNITHEYYAPMLFGKLFNVSEEGTAFGFKDPDVFKSLSSGGIVQARSPYEKPFEFLNRAKLIFAANQLPNTTDTSKGYFRRLVLVNFNASFDGSKADKFLRAKLLEERSGIFNLLIKAYAEMKERGYCYVSEKSQEAIDNYKIEADSVRQWFNTCVVKDDQAETPKSECFVSYEEFCKLERIKPKGKTNFGRHFMATFNVKDKHTRTSWVYEGIKLKEGNKY